MFNGAKGQASRPIKRSEISENSVTILTNGCHFTGKLFCKGSTRIGGTVEGEVISEGVLIIEQHAVLKAKITAEEVVVHGTVDGQVQASVRIELCKTSRFSGEIMTPAMAIQEGAIFSGRSIMDAEIKSFDNDVIPEYKTASIGGKIEGAISEKPEIQVM